MSKIVIIRGNSGSGKSTLAKALHKRIGRGALLVSQDYVRREMLRVKDEPDNQAIELLENLVAYGWRHCDFVILEGILYTDIYKSLFETIEDLFGDGIYAYCYDLPFEETLKRHRQKSVSGEFGEAEMRKWWRDGDYLTGIREKRLGPELCAEEAVEMICRDLAVGGENRGSGNG